MYDRWSGKQSNKFKYYCLQVLDYFEFYPRNSLTELVLSTISSPWRALPNIGANRVNNYHVKLSICRTDGCINECPKHGLNWQLVDYLSNALHPGCHLLKKWRKNMLIFYQMGALGLFVTWLIQRNEKNNILKALLCFRTCYDISKTSKHSI